MNFIKQLILVLASTSLATNWPVNQRCKLTEEELLVMRYAMLKEDKPEISFPTLINQGRITGTCSQYSNQYSLHELLQEAIEINRVDSFKFLYFRAHNSFGVDAFELFRKAYERENLEICDFLMAMNPSFNGSDFSRRYKIGDLMKLSERYPYRDHLFLLNNLSGMRGANSEAIIEAIDYIEYCSKKGYHFSSSALLSLVLENESLYVSLFDEDLFRIVERVLKMGAKVSRNPKMNFEEEFKAVYPKTYELLFKDNRPEISTEN